MTDDHIIFARLIKPEIPVEIGTTDEDLIEIFKRVGKEFYYCDVDAAFANFADIKVRWQRSYKWASFSVSDYFKGAPKDVVEDLARTIFARMTASGNEDYSDNFVEYLKSDYFIKTNQPTYVRRRSFLSSSVKGDHKNVRDSLVRLRKQNLIGDIPNLYLTWDQSRPRKAAFSSSVMKVVGVSSMLDAEDVPDEVIDYVIYCHLCLVGLGFRSYDDDYESEYAAKAALHPSAAFASEWLKANDMFVRGTDADWQIADMRSGWDELPDDAAGIIDRAMRGRSISEEATSMIPGRPAPVRQTREMKQTMLNMWGMDV